ncbi:hypothetical protein M0R45_030119 [Rubus argutus]|uniref:Uncharacterized protein n=1 Tax=Rubus argutus TaxID=59490 RepID=A0AAW1VMX9_RUBAR
MAVLLTAMPNRTCARSTIAAFDPMSCHQPRRLPSMCLSLPLLLIFPANHREPCASISSPRADLEIDLNCRSLRRFVCATE